jgi:hypothetical protein
MELVQHHNIRYELLKEVSNYLNLVASITPELLVQYIYQILNSILKGKHCLSRLVYQIGESNIKSMFPLMKYLIKILNTVKSSNDLMYILKTIYLISLNHTQVSFIFNFVL